MTLLPGRESRVCEVGVGHGLLRTPRTQSIVGVVEVVAYKALGGVVCFFMMDGADGEDKATKATAAMGRKGRIGKDLLCYF